MDLPAWRTELWETVSFVNCHGDKGWTAQEAIIQLRSHFCVIKYVGKGGKSPIKYWGNIVIKLISFHRKADILTTSSSQWMGLEQKLLILVGRKGFILGLVHVEDSVTHKILLFIVPFFSPWMVSWRSPFVKSLKSAIATQCGSRSELGDGLFPDNCLFPYM